jgi:membrane protein DedA with SNARE-associated domain
MKFKVDEIFAYNLERKRLNLIISGFVGLVILLFVLYYLFSLRHVDNFFVNLINGIFSHIFVSLKARSLLGAFYAAMFGGLFFIFMPVEAIFIGFLAKGQSPILIISVFIIGFLVSYSLDYVIGLKFANLAKKLITPKKFYKIKILVNNRGGWAIFLFNALPLPSQALSAILGVFRYNYKKFYLYFLLGQLVKFTVISLGYIYIL